MSELIGLLSQTGGRRPLYVLTRHTAVSDLLETGEVFSPSSLDGEEQDRFEQLVRYEELELAVEHFRSEVETYRGDDLTDDQYLVLFSARLAAVQQQLLIVKAVNGKVVQVHTSADADAMYVQPDYTERIKVLEERLASLAQELKPFVDNVVDATA